MKKELLSLTLAGTMILGTSVVAFGQGTGSTGSTGSTGGTSVGGTGSTGGTTGSGSTVGSSGSTSGAGSTAGTTAGTTNNDDGMDWGWLGLGGLIGLAGLMGRKRDDAQVRHAGTTDINSRRAA